MSDQHRVWLPQYSAMSPWQKADIVTERGVTETAEASGNGKRGDDTPPKPPSPAGCAPVAAETGTIFVAVALWIPLTYYLLPFLHETTPLSYSVTTALVLLFANGLRRMFLELQTPQTPPAK